MRVNFLILKISKNPVARPPKKPIVRAQKVQLGPQDAMDTKYISSTNFEELQRSLKPQDSFEIKDFPVYREDGM